MRYFLGIWFFVIVAVVSLMGFRGSKSTNTPLWVFPDMDIQDKFLPQGKNDFFEDGRNDRPVPAGVVLRGQGWDVKEVFSEDYSYAVAENPSLYSGKKANGEFYEGFPLEVTNDLLDLGQEKYEIFCQVCHGKNGDGNGITKQYGMLATPNYHSDRFRDMPEGEIYNTIVHGKNLMGAYGYKLRIEERWAIVAYVRALQIANNASINDVPGEFQSELGQ